MIKLGKTLSSTLIVLCLSTNAYAEIGTRTNDGRDESTEKVLAACDAALNAKIQEASLCGLGVQLRTNEIERLQTQNAKLLDRGSAWYSNPFVWAALGVIAGTYIGARTTR